MWFTCYLLEKIHKYDQVFLVKPHQHTHYGFGGLSKDELTTCFETKITVDVTVFAAMWYAYKDKELDKLTTLSTQLKKKHPFINNAIIAYIESVATALFPGKPTEILRTIL
ncbi:hypothetical protein [Urechidicola sp. KH5]